MKDEVTEITIPSSMTPVTPIIPIAKIIELRNKKLSYTDIGRLLGCTHSNIIQRLQNYKGSIDHLQSVKDNRADVLTVVGDGILNSLTPEDVQKASMLQKVTAVGILYDKERLERNQSTANVAYADYTSNYNELNAERIKLEAEVGLSQDADVDEDAGGPWTVDGEVE